MSAYWLKMIGTATMPCPDPYVLKFASYTRYPRQVRPGDKLILYAVGGFRTIFATAMVTSPVGPSLAEWWPGQPELLEQFPHCVEIEYEVNLRPPDGVDIGAANLDGHLPGIQFGHTHLRLSEEEFVYAAAKLREKATKLIRAR